MEFLSVSHTQIHFHPFSHTKTHFHRASLIRTHTHTRCHCAHSRPPSHLSDRYTQTYPHLSLLSLCSLSLVFSALCPQYIFSSICVHVGYLADETAACVSLQIWHWIGMKNQSFFFFHAQCRLCAAPIEPLNYEFYVFTLTIHSGYSVGQCLRTVYTSFSKSNMPAK